MSGRELERRNLKNGSPPPNDDTELHREQRRQLRDLFRRYREKVG